MASGSEAADQKPHVLQPWQSHRTLIAPDVNLRNYQYSEQAGEEWRIEPLPLGRFNLIVGRNATGKTRLLASIARMAALLSGELVFPQRDASWEVVFERGERFSTSSRAPAPASPSVISWASQLQLFLFAGRLNLRLPDRTRIHLAEAFRLATTQHGMTFHTRLIEELRQIGYLLDRVELLESPAGSRHLQVQEQGKSIATPFRRLSQAQQRTITLLTFLGSLNAGKIPATVLIDDFCEGLDFERATRLASFLLEGYPGLQLIVATNDRYVMNTIPLDFWTILVEQGPVTRVFNSANSRQKFENFKFTGLSNFDFFSMDFARPDA